MHEHHRHRGLHRPAIHHPASMIQHPVRERGKRRTEIRRELPAAALPVQNHVPHRQHAAELQQHIPKPHAVLRRGLKRPHVRSPRIRAHPVHTHHHAVGPEAILAALVVGWPPAKVHLRRMQQHHQVVRLPLLILRGQRPRIARSIRRLPAVPLPRLPILARLGTRRIILEPFLRHLRCPRRARPRRTRRLRRCRPLRLLRRRPIPILRLRRRRLLGPERRLRHREPRPDPQRQGQHQRDQPTHRCSCHPVHAAAPWARSPAPAAGYRSPAPRVQIVLAIESKAPTPQHPFPTLTASSGFPPAPA